MPALPFKLDLNTGFGEFVVGQQLTPTDVVVSITRDGSRRGRLGCAGVADVGRQCNASRLEQWADDAGGGRAQGHRPPVFADRDLLKTIKVAQKITPSSEYIRNARLGFSWDLANHKGRGHREGSITTSYA